MSAALVAMRVAILLAAGSSRRMGERGSKLDLDLGGLTVLERSVRAFLAAPFEAVFVVVAPGTAHRLPRSERLRTVVNAAPERGMASSLRAGLEAIPRETSLVAIGLADMPLIRTDTITRLIKVAAQTGDDGAHTRVVYPIEAGEPGHPVLFPARVVPELLRLSGDRGARAILDRFIAEGNAVSVPVEDPGVRLDIDSADDYARAKALVSK